MTDGPVVLERDGALATVRLNRPEAMNSLDVATKEALLAAIDEVTDDDQVRCVVLTGTGRAFCVGQDLKEHVDLLAQGADALFTTVPEHYNPIVTALSTMNKPVVAAVNGVAAGAGAAFAFACDLRICSEDAGFNLAFAGIALSCDSGSSFWLPRLVGMAKAKELLLMPRTVRAPEALTLGLATEVVAADDFAARVHEVGTRLADGPTLSYGAMRRAVEFSATHTLAESLAHEAELMTATGSTDDHHAAVDAFLNKRAPEFTGH
ncbi:enoyl-CoA hydratase/isomerase family protein [Rudaeicoccus suwonensis]|uniref:2-(1,2-epoxy-1,2-dihydrophenyl)acetyl-CoA isomerase n=1 Tax=Rudaeicoccus suwonensis TaxID=657409 RepID=A0A561E140_9MICO|nr:enoyl-CoA hydratase-related protein [Rudaeicoccus suwonensis]TWE09356.1 2-(1,2-epoxy-1,2-dihydrophenyl)acetyl-CoA isomerase [Rudaeicoccus suwonensis]